MKNFLKLAFVLMTLIWFAGFVFFEVSMHNLQQDKSIKTDAIIVLTGGNGRVKEAMNLLHEGLGEKLLISGVSVDTTLDQIFLKINMSQHKNELSSKVTLGYSAFNTEGNAIESKNWVEKNGFKSIRIVTSDYHMLRSLNEMKKIMKNVEFVPHPIYSKSKNSSQARKQLSEYHKYLYTIISNI